MRWHDINNISDFYIWLCCCFFGTIMNDYLKTIALFGFVIIAGLNKKKGEVDREYGLLVFYLLNGFYFLISNLNLKFHFYFLKLKLKNFTIIYTVAESYWLDSRITNNAGVCY